MRCTQTWPAIGRPGTHRFRPAGPVCTLPAPPTRLVTCATRGSNPTQHQTQCPLPQLCFAQSWPTTRYLKPRQHTPCAPSPAALLLPPVEAPRPPQAEATNPLLHPLSHTPSRPTWSVTGMALTATTSPVTRSSARYTVPYAPLPVRQRSTEGNEHASVGARGCSRGGDCGVACRCSRRVAPQE